jgi:CheY-like chemotaxis protein
MGLPKETLEDIFDLFGEAEGVLGWPQGKLSSGLAVVQKLIHMHGGSLEVFSEGRGYGSEFVVRLPAVNESAREDHSVTPVAGKSQVRKQRVLVVEDHGDVADAFAMLLRAKGFDVRVAPDGEAALEAAHRFQPGVAFVDIGLPKMDGYEVARRLRATFSVEQLLLVALTAYGQREDVQRAQQAGFDHHLLKPAKLVDIQNLIQTHRAAPIGEASRAE